MNMTTQFCQTCSDVTTLSSTGCIFSTRNCSRYSEEAMGWCSECEVGFVEVRRACLLEAQNCREYGLDRSKCRRCNDGYHLDGTLCYVDVLGCQTYSSQSICVICKK